MLNIFLNKNIDINYPIQHYTKFDYVKRKYLEQLSTVKNYYYNKEQAVDNRHLLNRIINTLLPDIFNNDIVDYFSMVSNNAELTSKQFGIVSNINYGNVLSNIFYGKNSKEILLYTENEIDLNTIETNWRELTSVKVIYNENIDLNLPLPSAAVYIPNTLVIMEIDIVLLLLQYRGWYLERINLEMSTNINIFISQIVYTNMIDNILDLALVNRLEFILADIDMPIYKNTHPFLVVDYSENIDNVLKTMIKDNSNKSIPITQLLITLPAISNSNMLETLYIGHRYYTMQSKWVLWVSRINYINIILNILGNKGIRRNKDILTRLPIMLKRLERNSVIPRKLDDIVYSDFILSVDEILKKIKK